MVQALVTRVACGSMVQTGWAETPMLSQQVMLQEMQQTQHLARRVVHGSMVQMAWMASLILSQQRSSQAVPELPLPASRPVHGAMEGRLAMQTLKPMLHSVQTLQGLHLAMQLPPRPVHGGMVLLVKGLTQMHTQGLARPMGHLPQLLTLGGSKDGSTLLLERPGMLILKRLVLLTASDPWVRLGMPSEPATGSMADLERVVSPTRTVLWALTGPWVSTGM